MLAAQPDRDEVIALGVSIVEYGHIVYDVCAEAVGSVPVDGGLLGGDEVVEVSPRAVRTSCWTSNWRLAFSSWLWMAPAAVAVDMLAPCLRMEGGIWPLQSLNLLARRLEGDSGSCRRV